MDLATDHCNALLESRKRAAEEQNKWLRELREVQDRMFNPEEESDE